MSFFRKLKSKLFKSSAQLEEGLDTIVRGDVAPEDIAEDETPIVEVPQAVVQLKIKPELLVEPPDDDEPLVKAIAVIEAPEAPKVVFEPLEIDTTPINPLPEKSGVFGRTPRRVMDDDMLEQLEELLISSDMGVDTAVRITANLAEGRFGK